LRLKKSGADAEGGDGGGFGAENAWAERNRLPGMIGEELHFVGGPSAFGANGQSDVAEGCGWIRGMLECRGERVVLLGFGEQELDRRGDFGERLLEREWVVDLREIAAARLLCGLKDDATPAFDTFGGGEREMFFSASRKDRCDARGAKLGEFFETPLIVIELDDGEKKVNGKRSFGLEFLAESEGYLPFADVDDCGTAEESVGYNVENLSRFGAENAGEVDRLVAGERGGRVGEDVGDPAAARHRDQILDFRC